MREESWKFRCQPQRLATFNVRSTGKPVALKRSARQKYACIVEADESTRKRMEESLHKYHEDHIAEIRLNPKSPLELQKCFLMVCKEVRGKILRTGEQNNSTVIQSRNTMH